MLFDLNELPTNVTPFGILHWKKIKKIKSTIVKPGTKKLFEEFGWRMVKTCLAEEGIGLAAPQCGVFKKFILCRNIDGSGQEYKFTSKFRLYINPSFSPVIADGKKREKEYCLSVPNKGYDIERYQKIVIDWDEPNEIGIFDKKQEILEGWSARLFLHEFDHLNGVSIPQRWELQNKNNLPRGKNHKK